MGPRAGLENVERRKILSLPELKLRPFGRPARSQSLYRLSYPGSHFDFNDNRNIKKFLQRDTFISSRGKLLTLGSTGFSLDKIEPGEGAAFQVRGQKLWGREFCKEGENYVEEEVIQRDGSD
jgi:hypothetical protein